MIDQDSKGSISKIDFVSAMEKFSQADDEEKIVFLFKIYDTEGNFYFVRCLQQKGFLR